ncbi:MAG: hypothetical protein ACREBS_01735 [Nitrososphaerales archaeon]
MISYAITVLGIIGATLIPAYIALYVVRYLLPVHTRYIAAAGVGLTFWYFFDTMNDATSLDVNQALYPFSLFGGPTHFAVIFAFIAGIVTLAILDHLAVSSPDVTPSSKALFLIPVAVAAVMGIHSLGEGWNFGSAAASVPAQGVSSFCSPALLGSPIARPFCDLANAFGGLNTLISYPLHKFLEASIIGAVYTCSIARNKTAFRAAWHLPALGLLFGLTSVIGSALGYYFILDTTYFYAFGVTAALYAVLRLVESVSSRSRIWNGAPAYLGTKVFLAMTIGFFLLYAAALLH